MGKGGGSAPAPASQTVNQSNLPEYARPYFEDIMTRGTTASNTAYQPYTGQRVADFTPMQQQAFQGIQNLGTSPLLQPAAGLTGAAGLGGLGAGQQYTQQATSPGAMQSYMSPYMQNVVDWQKTQAINDYGRQLPGQQAAATRAGAFGGSRQAIVESEAQRNLQNQLGGIQAQGTQQAFDQANKNLQFGSQLGLQGLGLAGQMGQQFGQLGQTAFGQEAAAAQAQQQAGALQQAQTQQGLDKRYEEFMQQKYYPQEQLQFLSSLLRGSVVAPQQTQYTYQAQPSMVSQIGGLGLGALGLSKAFGAKEGGEVPGYAAGGITGGEGKGMLTDSEITRAVQQLSSGLDIRQTSNPTAAMIVMADPIKREKVNAALAIRNQQAIDRGIPQGTVMDEMGLAGMDAGVMDGEYAGGGIVAFNQGGDRGEERTETTAGRWWRGLMDSNEAKAAYAAQQERYKRELEAAKATPGLFEPLTANQRQTREEQAAGLLALAQPQTRVPSTVGEPEPTVYAQQKPPVSPGTQQAPAARPTATSAPAIKPAVDEFADLRKTVADQEKKLQTEDQAEAARRDAYKKAIPDDLQQRLDTYKSEAAEALKERDKDRWLAVAMGGFTAAAASSPYALRNLAEGFNMTTKEMMTINKDFRKLESERQKLIREEQRLDRAEKMGIEKDIFAARDRATARRDSFDQYKTNVELNLAKIAKDKWKTLEENRSRERVAGIYAGGREAAADTKSQMNAMQIRYNQLANEGKGNTPEAKELLASIENLSKAVKPPKENATLQILEAVKAGRSAGKTSSGASVSGW